MYTMRRRNGKLGIGLALAGVFFSLSNYLKNGYAYLATLLLLRWELDIDNEERRGGRQDKPMYL